MFKITFARIETARVDFSDKWVPNEFIIVDTVHEVVESLLNEDQKVSVTLLNDASSGIIYSCYDQWEHRHDVCFSNRNRKDWRKTGPLAGVLRDLWLRCQPVVENRFEDLHFA